MLAPLYYCELDSTTVPIVLSLNIYGDKRLAVNGESDEKFQQRVLDMAEKISSGNAPSFAATSFPWKTAFVCLFFPGTLSCLTLTRTCTHSFWTFIVPATLASLLSRRMTSKSLCRKISETKAGYYKEAIQPAGYRDCLSWGRQQVYYIQKSFSWTTSYKAACFFACRIPSLENSRIITAHINKSDIIEYFPDDEEKEVLVPTAAVKDVKVDVLLGINALTDEIQAFYPLYQHYRSRISTLYDAYGRANDEEHDAEHTLRVLFDALLLVQVQGIALTRKESHQLCDAILYHDIGRTNDDVDDSHGAKSRTFIMTQSPTAIRQLLSSSSIIAWMTARLLQTSKHPIFETKNGCGCYIRFSRMQML